MKIHIPAFEPMLKANEHLRHGAFDIDLGENVVEVVRCKNCAFWEDYGNNGRCECGENGLIREYTKPDDFCSYGKRRDGGNK